VQALERREQRRYRNIRKRVGSACLDLEIERVTTLLESWLAVEVQRDGDFHVVEQEDSHELTLGALTLNLRPDRIDRLDDGREIVIDYKTGSVKRSSWLGERPSDAQLPLYALLNDSVEGVAFGRVHQEGVEYVFLGEALGLGGKELALEDQVKRYESEPVASWEALRATWRHRLEGLANDFVRGHAAIDPQPNACRYCALGSVCRYSQNAELPEETLFNLEEGAL
jgi:ATP-dependent helicase/nuclease subunit B